MLSTEQFFEAFNRAGFLTDATWTPSNGSAAQTARVDFRSAALSLLGDAVSATQYQMSYPASKFADLREGETVAIEGKAYRVLEVKPGEDVSIKLAILATY